MNEMDPDLTHTRWRSKQTWSAAQSSDLMETFHCLPQLQTCFIHRNLKMWFWIHTHVRREQLSNVRLLFCTIKTQLTFILLKFGIGSVKVGNLKKYLKCRYCVGGSCCGLVGPRRQLSSTLTTTQPGFFLPLYKPLEPKMTQSEPQRQSEPRRLLHAVYNWHKYTEPL